MPKNHLVSLSRGPGLAQHLLPVRQVREGTSTTLQAADSDQKTSEIILNWECLCQGRGKSVKVLQDERTLSDESPALERAVR